MYHSFLESNFVSLRPVRFKVGIIHPLQSILFQLKKNLLILDRVRAYYYCIRNIFAWVVYSSLHFLYQPTYFSLPLPVEILAGTIISIQNMGIKSQRLSFFYIAVGGSLPFVYLGVTCANGKTESRTPWCWLTYCKKLFHQCKCAFVELTRLQKRQ